MPLFYTPLKEEILPIKLWHYIFIKIYNSTVVRSTEFLFYIFKRVNSDIFRDIDHLI